MAKSKKEMLPISELTEKQLELRNIAEFILNQMGTTLLKVFTKERKRELVLIRHSLFALFDKNHCQIDNNDPDYITLTHLGELFGFDHSMVLHCRKELEGLTERSDKKLFDVWQKVLKYYPLAKEKTFVIEYHDFHIKKSINNKILVTDYKKHIPNIFDTIKEAKSFIDGYNYCNNKFI